MPGRISDSVIQQILDRVNLVELISQQVKLTRAGREYRGRCPFHADKDPSFYVNPENGQYHCFGCKEGGNAVSFLTRTRGMGFTEAIVHLAESVGVEVHFSGGNEDIDAFRKGRERKRQLFEVNREAHAFFRTSLHGPQGVMARQYLAKRGIDAEMISRFQIGVAPEGGGLYDMLVRSGTNLSMAGELGLVVVRPSGTFDRFRHRVMFPVLTAGEDIAGFSGRTLDPEGIPKYLNSPESDVFRKGSLVFGLTQGREQIRKRGFCLLVEGQLDVVALHQAGFENAVAPLGTALTVEQCAAIRRFVDDVYVMFDGDHAGRKATWRAIELLLESGLHGKVVSLPDGEDPDSLLRKQGREALEEAISSASPMLEFVVEQLFLESAGTVHGRSAAGRRGVEVASHISDSLERTVFIDRLAERLSLPRKELSRGVNSSIGAVLAVAAVGGMSRLERRLTEILLLRPDLVKQLSHEDIYDLLESTSLRNLVRVVLDEMEENGGVDAGELVERLGDGELKELWGALNLRSGVTPEGELELELEQRLESMTVQRLKREIERLSREVKEAQGRGDSAAMQTLFLEQEGMWKRLGELEQVRRRASKHGG